MYKCINDYVIYFIVTAEINHFIRELCIRRDSGGFSVLTSTEMSQLLEYICTIQLCYSESLLYIYICIAFVNRVPFQYEINIIIIIMNIKYYNCEY